VKILCVSVLTSYIILPRDKAANS